MMRYSFYEKLGFERPGIVPKWTGGVSVILYERPWKYNTLTGLPLKKLL